jgi:hypothetical protein
MKTLLFVIFTLCLNLLSGQALKDSIKNSPRNQLDVGVNFSYFFDGYRCPIKMDRSYELLSSEFERRPYNALFALYMCYKRMINTKLFILVSQQPFDPGYGWFQNHPGEYLKGDLTWRAGYTSYGIGGGRIFKKDNFQAALSLQLIYALNYFRGGRSVFWEYSGDSWPLFERHIPCVLRYYDKYGYGIAPGAETNYFLNKNIGIGVNFNLNYFPFATSRFENADIYITDPYTEEDIAKYNRPARLILGMNLKVVYRFRDPKFLR